MKIEEYFKLLNLVFYGPLYPSIGISGPSLNSLEKMPDLSFINHKTCLKRCQNYM